MKEEEFKIQIKTSESLPNEGKRKLLWQCFDILFSNNSIKKSETKCLKKKVVKS